MKKCNICGKRIWFWQDSRERSTPRRTYWYHRKCYTFADGVIRKAYNKIMDG